AARYEHAGVGVQTAQHAALGGSPRPVAVPMLARQALRRGRAQRGDGGGVLGNGCGEGQARDHAARTVEDFGTDDCGSCRSLIRLRPLRSEMRTMARKVNAMKARLRRVFPFPNSRAMPRTINRKMMGPSA